MFYALYHCMPSLQGYVWIEMKYDDINYHCLFKNDGMYLFLGYGMEST